VTHYDLVVLGAGASGLGAAREARRLGRSVALVDVDRPGGDCTHYGCVPSKALLETARRVHAARSGAAYGFRADVEVDMPRVMDRVQAVIAEIEQDESPELLAEQGIDLVRGWATFTSPTTLDVGGRVLRSRRFVVASGSRAAVPPVEGLRDVPYLDNRSVFALRELPEHLVVLGGGPIGVELAQALRRLGAQVTVVEAAPGILSREEPEAARALTAVLEREGVVLRTGVSVVRVTAGPVLHLEDGGTVEGTHLLVAVGRTPSTDGFGLDVTGTRVDGAGRVVTDRHLRAADTVWAAGDCTSPLQFTHVGFEQGRIAAKNAFGRAGQPGSRLAWDDRVVPWVTFTEPEVAHVGMTERQAYAAYGDRVRVSTVPDTRSDRARTAGGTDGFVKLLALPPRVGGSPLAKLVGMTVVGPMAGEQIAEGALAMRSGMLAFRLAQVVKAYPTYGLSTRVAAARLFREQDGERARPARG
jgi:pyruvate/2-oxoglutarate dehydrogenase complex dihydrolipoamide dehydrogenase (E3) component